MALRVRREYAGRLIRLLDDGTHWGVETSNVERDAAPGGIHRQKRVVAVNGLLQAAQPTTDWQTRVMANSGPSGTRTLPRQASGGTIVPGAQADRTLLAH